MIKAHCVEPIGDALGIKHPQCIGRWNNDQAKDRWGLRYPYLHINTRNCSCHMALGHTMTLLFQTAICDSVVLFVCFPLYWHVYHVTDCSSCSKGPWSSQWQWCGPTWIWWQAWRTGHRVHGNIQEKKKAPLSSRPSLVLPHLSPKVKVIYVTNADLPNKVAWI